MKRRDLTAALVSAAWVGRLGAAPSESEAAAAVRELLERSVLAAVLLLGRNDGFLGQPRWRIPLPAALEAAAQARRAAGQGRRVDALVVAMNRAAEASLAAARPLLGGAVRDMSIEDALQLVAGGPTSATRYFAAKSRASLARRLLPEVMRAAGRMNLAALHADIAGRPAGATQGGGGEQGLLQHVTGRALDGVYLVAGGEEQRLRADPARSGSALLQRVFGT